MNDEPVKFLLVDDVEENLVALEALLRRDGLELLKARSGTEALELLLKHDVALAFLDVQMPGMDGFELAELMRGAERTKRVPIIFVTAGTSDPWRVFKGYESGAVDFLHKPIEPHVLRGKADVFFELYRQGREWARALQLNEMFVGILGHDLRNPLGALLTGAALLQAQIKDPKQLRTLQRMTSAGRRMTEMIEQLLDLTRARLAGGLGFGDARHNVDVTGLAQRAVEELQAVHPERRIVVLGAAGATTLGDPDRLLQLFSNLVANALHHGKADAPVHVEVSVSAEDVTFSVQNGGTIPAELLPTLFDPFRRRPTQRAHSQGLGLGLYISQQIALAHDGRIQVTSSEEGGTLFTLRIPRRSLGARPPEGEDSATGVLIVDDERDTRESLERELYQSESSA
ncbi:MAG TPA: hybrid sensor histidine kinase/response regulator [Polyangiaceae bacterium]|nr:hybrid sensor histidine kinase/response regulator [Polyangiaceae bacterium]